MKYYHTQTDPIDNEKYSSLLIETEVDLNLFISYDSIIRSKQAVNFWMSFKTQSFYSSMNGYLQHEKESKNIAMLCLMALHVDLHGVSSVAEYCAKADSLLDNKYNSMRNIIYSGKCVRVNHIGGYSAYNEAIHKMDEEQSIDISSDGEKVKNFILVGDIKLSIPNNKKCIVLENADYKPERFITEIKDILNYKDNKDIVCITNLKLKTILWSKNDYIKYFTEAFINGMNTLAFQSTFQDMRQFTQMKDLLIHLVDKLNIKDFTVYFKPHCTSKIKLELENIIKETKNIKIVLLK